MAEADLDPEVGARVWESRSRVWRAATGGLLHRRFCIGGTLAASPAAVAAPAAGSAPTTDEEYPTVATRSGVDGWLLRRLEAAAQEPGRALSAERGTVRLRRCPPQRAGSAKSVELR